MATLLPPIPTVPGMVVVTDTFDASDVELAPVVWTAGTITITTPNASWTNVKPAKRRARLPMKPRRTKMQLVIVPPHSVPMGHPCALCGKSARPGQRAFYQKVYATRATTLFVVIHEACVSDTVGGEAKVIGSKAEREYHINREYDRIRESIERGEEFL